MNHYLEKPASSFLKARANLPSIREKMVSTKSKAIDILSEKRAKIAAAMLYQHELIERKNKKSEMSNSTIQPLPTLPPMPNPFVMPDFLLNDLFIESTDEIAAEAIDPDMVSIEQPAGSESEFETIEENEDSHQSDYNSDAEEDNDSNPEDDDDYEDVEDSHDESETEDHDEQ